MGPTVYSPSHQEICLEFYMYVVMSAVPTGHKLTVNPCTDPNRTVVLGTSKRQLFIHAHIEHRGREVFC